MADTRTLGALHHERGPVSLSSEGPPARYFRSVHAAFEDACHAAGGSVDRYYSLAGFSVRFRFAGPALLPYVTPAFAHLESQSPLLSELTINIWESDTTGVRLPAAAWRTEDLLPRGEVRDFDDGRFLLSYIPDWHMIEMLDRESDLGLFWVPHTDALNVSEISMPLRRTLNWWMSAHNRQLVHSAAVATSQSGALIVGKGGSGKSTTALACLSGGLCYLGDDYIALQTEPEPFAHSLFNSAKLSAESLARLPAFAHTVLNEDRPDGEKGMIFLNEHFPDHMMRGVPIRYILMPCVTGLSETRLHPASAVAGLRALAPSTLFWMPYSGGGALHAMAQFVQRTPCYILEVGTDMTQIPRVVSRLING